MFSRISVRLLMTKKMKRELKMTPMDINSLLLTEVRTSSAAFPGVLVTVAVGTSTALFTTGFVVVFVSSLSVPSLITTAVALFFSGTDWRLSQEKTPGRPELLGQQCHPRKSEV